ncbi:hypothetical protein CRG98_003606 [Punica granatum]|uniref:Uncharacterized protein n=1 Tax=Punica granatum TaxID=22663 RepID=A0A2I0L7G4_PUNGR|nr:hypothetical protein CRG98_003606 [Punica granatum]
MGDSKRWLTAVGKRRDEEDPLKRYKPLHEAAVKGDWEAAESIFNEDTAALKAIITSRRETALHVAVDHGRAEFVEKLVARMATGDLEIKTDKQSRKRTALHYAVVSGSLPIVRTLVEKNGKLMEIVDDKKYSPLHEAAYYFESKEVVRYLISKMPDVTPPYKDSPFFADDCSKGAELIARLVDSRAYGKVNR